MAKPVPQDNTDSPRQDRMVTPERSVFGTQLPRPIGVGRHLIVVVVLSVLALVMAIVFAESNRPESATENPAPNTP